MAFRISEDNLTDAVFYGTFLEVDGSGGTKSEARQQARLMLAAAELLKAAEFLIELLDLADAEIPCGWISQEERWRLDAVRGSVARLQKGVSP